MLGAVVAQWYKTKYMLDVVIAQWCKIIRQLLDVAVAQWCKWIHSWFEINPCNLADFVSFF